MDLSKIYTLRRNFVVVGLTGRTGSGCTKISKVLTNDFENLKNGLRNKSEFKDSIFFRKYNICYKYLKHDDNWVPFELIRYKDVLLFYLLSKIGNEESQVRFLFEKYYNKDLEKPREKEIIDKIMIQMKGLYEDFKSQILAIRKYNGDFKDLRTDEELVKLHDLFFKKDFNKISNKIFGVLESFGYYERTLMLHRVANNIRRNGDPLDNKNSNMDSIYLIAHLINRLIKSKKHVNKKQSKPTKIVIDSLRNSLEIMFFKERYSGFYMVATKDSKDRAESRLKKRLTRLKNENIETLAKDLLDLDDTEYKTNDFGKGKFYTPDVENCIQKSDIHIINRKILDIVNPEENNDYENFYTREEQIMKILCLISQPGIITPSSVERGMHVAHIAKSNSGCISRQVGAVVTDKNYSVRAIGWNDVPAGLTPCNLRDVNDYFNDDLNEETYSDFERGVKLKDTEFKYKDKFDKGFKSAIKDYFNDSKEEIQKGLSGKNCSFCFKTIHNKYEDEKNQVHTRSLHAEENAMLQISKYGGQALEGGVLFTTASPCELCSKKAFQLGIKTIYYIDPYPGISKSQILSGGIKEFRPKMMPFKGVIGKSYSKLYEPFMAYKDEVKMMLK